MYGVSREDAARMDLLLGQVDSAEHGQRMFAGTVMLAQGAFFGALGATAFAFDRSDPATPRSSADAFGGISVGIGALSLAYGVYTMARPWAGERLAADYREALRGGDYARAFALANERINGLAAAEAHDRWFRGIASGVVLLGSTAGLVASELSATSDSQRFTVQAIGGAGIVLGVAGIASALFVQSPIERLTNVWLRDPGIIHIQPTLSPTTSGATFGLVGTF